MAVVITTTHCPSSSASLVSHAAASTTAPCLLDFSFLYVPQPFSGLFLAVISWSLNIECRLGCESANPKRRWKAMGTYVFNVPSVFCLSAAVLALGPSKISANGRRAIGQVACIVWPWLKYALSRRHCDFGLLTTLCCTSCTLAGMVPWRCSHLLFPDCYVHASTYHTPVHAIVLNAAVTTVMSLGLDFERIVAMSSRVLLTVTADLRAVILLRVRHPTLRPCATLGVLGCVLLTPAFLFSLIVTFSCMVIDSWYLVVVGLCWWVGVVVRVCDMAEAAWFKVRSTSPSLFDATTSTSSCTPLHSQQQHSQQHNERYKKTQQTSTKTTIWNRWVRFVRVVL